eukprot:CAMPEP_0172935440 /NCGR_PEP_ID=MMETSP1075-20121228/221515_1 /TAXON_ID=2916 /ORGANISM="Ceratium fusus, Strain PA161109" /LENGTH=346 /DNA_ID=CAMNT_0013796799 /DNA_START=33 /DNA_END=1073 /DNA_ORIENTATION=+
MPTADLQATASEGAARNSPVHAFDGMVGSEPVWIRRSRKLGPLRSHSQGSPYTQRPTLLAGPPLPPCSNLEERIFKLPSGTRGPESRRHTCHEDIVTVLRGSMETKSAERRLPGELPGTISVLEKRLVKQRQPSPRFRSTELASKVYTSPVLMPMSPGSARVRRQSRKLQPLSQEPTTPPALHPGQAVGPRTEGLQQPRQPQQEQQQQQQQQQQQNDQQSPRSPRSPQSPRSPRRQIAPNTEVVTIPELARLAEDETTLVPSESEAHTGETPEAAELGESIGAWLEQGVDKAVERWDKLATMDLGETVRVDSPSGFTDDLSRNTSRRSRSSEKGFVASETVGDRLP